MMMDLQVLVEVLSKGWSIEYEMKMKKMVSVEDMS